MKTYAELKAEADALNAQAEAVRKEERIAAIAACNAKIKEFALAAFELKFSEGQLARKPRTKKPAQPATHKGPFGQLWVENKGAGRRPKWVTDAIERGVLDQYRIAPV